MPNWKTWNYNVTSWHMSMMTQIECQITTDFCTGLLLHLSHKMDLLLR